MKYYVAFKRLKNFACIEVHPAKACISLFLKVDPKSIQLEEGFTRDVTATGHFGTGGLEVTLRQRKDLERAKNLIVQSYDAS